ncbi:hypothetical protein BZG36_03460 [Bifiguratus adelaidae]|uniref:RNA polymerase II subunit A C-terminal domain phosphatase SSU72 n=1 Tax=Bifiguratus adelaidae TaxID=1938954 RepID=A0A261XZK6_9FUNG|nr:hypothetical protein BZG36_03460 [Bifiguratus adelaidae]
MVWLWLLLLLPVLYAISYVHHRIRYSHGKLHQLVGKRVIISGASKGIGEKLAYCLAQHGAHVIIAARSQDKLNQVAEKCQALGSASALAVRCDAAQEDDCKQLIMSARKHFEAQTGDAAIDMLILNHCVGVWNAMDLDNPESNIELSRQLMDINYFGYLNILFHALRTLLNTPRSHVVAISSVCSFSPVPSKAHAYAATKAAITNYFHSLRGQLRHAKKTYPSVTICVLGAIKTDYFRTIMAEGDKTASKLAVSDEITAEMILIAALNRDEELFFPWYVWIKADYIHVNKMTRRLVSDMNNTVGPAIDKPNIYPFGTPYEQVYQELKAKNPQLYTQNGLLNMLDRNRKIKLAPQRWQESKDVYDVIITCEERCFDAVCEDLANRGESFNMPVHVINVEIKDSHEDATLGGRAILQLAQLLEQSENLDDDIETIIEKFYERNSSHALLHATTFY